MSNKNVYVVTGCRTGIGNFNGQYKDISATTLGSTCIKECLNRSEIAPSEIDEVIMGHVLVTGQGQNPARQAAVGAGIPFEVPAYTINMLCGSGLKAVHLGYQAIQTGSSRVVICGGQENMTRSQHAAFQRQGTRLGNVQLVDTLLCDGLTDAFENIHMGATAEYLAQKWPVTRQDQDDFAKFSQLKAKHATDSGFFDREIVEVKLEKSSNVLKKDEFIKMDPAQLEKIDTLKPCFEKDPSKLQTATVTPGNSSGINDGAAVVILCDDETIQRKKLKPLLKLVAFAQVGCQPKEMGIAPIEAIRKVLANANWKQEDVDLFELNEAFAVQSKIVMDRLGLDPKKVNISGGAIALGHPIGASGARVLITLMYNLERFDLQKGVAALCIGGGMGIAVAVERCS